MRWVLVGAVLGGCYAPEPIAGVRCGANGACPDGFVCSPATDRCERDATGIDAMLGDGGPFVDAAPGCFGTGVISICPQVQPTEPLMLSGTLDTVIAPICVPYEGPPGLCVIAGTDVSVMGTLVVTGARPLVIVGTRTVTVGGRVDANSRRNGMSGPDANAEACVAYNQPQNRRGGAGGSLGGVGGKGGGQNNAQTPAPASTVTSLRGGCRGSDGGGPGPAAQGGSGGGAIALLAGEMITITGSVNASGAGGQGGPEEAGGAGGGSGGMVVLDAPTVRIVSTGSVFANGGGGGGSGAGTQGGQGGSESTTALGAASGGIGGAGGGARGGDGAAGASSSGQDGVTGQDEIGSGGGGGAGVIKVYAPSRVIEGTLSPAPT